MAPVTLGVLCLMLFPTAALASLSCEKPISTSQTSECVTKIKEAVLDRSLFWFGADFESKCLEESTPLINCIVGFQPKQEGYNLYEFLYPDTSDALNDIAQILTVTYDSPQGEYEACSHEFIVENDVTFDLDPLSNQSYPAWNTRNMPEVTWVIKPDVQYSLFILDVSSGVLHGAWINIPGNDVSSGTVMKSYTDPKNVRIGLGNPYVFLLYEQNMEDINVTAELTQLLNVRLPVRFNLTALVSPDAMNLTGPVGINWVLVTGDTYSVGRAWQAGYAMNCAPYIVQAFDALSTSFVSRNDVQLTLFVNMTFSPPDVSYTACCQTNSFPEETLVLDPVGDKEFPAIQTQTGTPFSITLVPNTFFPYPRFDFSGRNFTVLEVDTDAPFPLYGTPDLPFLHGLYTNIPAPGGVLDFTNGRAIVDFAGPLPPPGEAHHYFFLVLEQQYTLDIDSTAAYIGENCPESRPMKCLFNVTKFLNDNNLDLVGITWFTTQNDDWVNLQYGTNETDFCAGRDGYSDPCSLTDAAPHLTPMYGTIIPVVSVLVSLLTF